MSSSLNKIFHSKVFIVLAASAFAFCGIALWREASGTFQVKKEIAKLEQQAQDLQQKNQNLKELVDYLESSAYQEKAAREQLNLQLPGEVAIALPSSIQSRAMAKAETEVQKVREHDGVFANVGKWWDYFFGVAQ